MNQLQGIRHFAEIHASGIGGIDDTAVSVSPDVTVPTERNATNRISFLQAVMAALGSTYASFKGDVDSGEVKPRQTNDGDMEGPNSPR